MLLKNDFDDHPVILFDGICNLCNASVQQIIKRDKRAHFRFASLQSQAAQHILSQQEGEIRNIDSIVLRTGNAIYVKSDAFLHICQALGGMPRYLYILRIIPRFVRDGLYDWLAKNRYHWFGKRDLCMIPAPELEDRFLI